MRVRLFSLRPRALAFPFPQSRASLLVPAVAAAVALAALILLAQTGYVTSAGYRLRSLERIQTTQHRSIQQLQADVAALNSLSRAGQEAKERWGMAAPQKLLYIMVDRPPATLEENGTASSPIGR